MYTGRNVKLEFSYGIMHGIKIDKNEIKILLNK